MCQRDLCPPAFVCGLPDEKGSCTSEKTEQPWIVSLSSHGLGQSLLAEEGNESYKWVGYC